MTTKDQYSDTEEKKMTEELTATMNFRVPTTEEITAMSSQIPTEEITAMSSQVPTEEITAMSSQVPTVARSFDPQMTTEEFTEYLNTCARNCQDPYQSPYYDPHLDPYFDPDRDPTAELTTKNLVNAFYYQNPFESLRMIAHMNPEDLKSKELVFAACQSRMNVPLERLLKIGAPLLETDENGKTLLHHACEARDVHCVNVIIDELKRRNETLHSFLNMKSNDGITALCVVTCTGADECVKKLLEEGADPRITNTDGNSMLHVALSNNRHRCFQMILEKNTCDINSKKDDGTTLLHISCEMRYAEATQQLLELGANPNVQRTSHITNIRNIETPLHIACVHRDIDCVRILLADPRIDIKLAGKTGMTPLHVVCERGWFEGAKLLLDHKDRSAVRHCLEMKHIASHFESDLEPLQFLDLPPEISEKMKTFIANQKGKTPREFANEHEERRKKYALEYPNNLNIQNMIQASSITDYIDNLRW